MNDEADPIKMRTLFLEILMRCRAGLNLHQENFVATHYCTSSLICMFRYVDNKLYKLTVSEVSLETPNKSDSV